MRLSTPVSQKPIAAWKDSHQHYSKYIRVPIERRSTMTPTYVLIWLTGWPRYVQLAGSQKHSSFFLFLVYSSTLYASIDRGQLDHQPINFHDQYGPTNVQVKWMTRTSYESYSSLILMLSFKPNQAIYGLKSSKLPFSWPGRSQMQI